MVTFELSIIRMNGIDRDELRRHCAPGRPDCDIGADGVGEVVGEV